MEYWDDFEISSLISRLMAPPIDQFLNVLKCFKKFKNVFIFIIPIQFISGPKYIFKVFVTSADLQLSFYYHLLEKFL